MTAIEAGNFLAAACDFAGVHRSNVYRWLRRAEEADAAEERGEILNREAREFQHFRDMFCLARARFAEHALSIVWQAVEGGVLISEAPVKDSRGAVVRDGDGKVLYQRQYTAPDGELALELLKRLEARPAEPWERRTLASGAHASPHLGPHPDNTTNEE